MVGANKFTLRNVLAAGGLVTGLALGAVLLVQSRVVPVAEAAPERIPMPKWAPSLEDGLRQAKERGCALLVALNMDNERGNQGMVDNVYTSDEFRDAAKDCVVAIASMFQHPTTTDPDSGQKVCARFGSVTCEHHRAIEETVRHDWLKKGPKDDLDCPQHFLLAPDGRILFQRTWTLDASRLAGMMKRASELCRPEILAAWDTRQGRLARAVDPNPDIRDEALSGLIAENDPALDKELLMLAKTTKVEGAAGNIAGAFARAESPERRAHAYPFLSHKDEDVRRRTAFAMELSASPDHVKELVKRVGKEKDDRALGCVYRALGACGADDDKVVKLLTKALGNKKDEARENAAVALGAHAKDKDVYETAAEVAFHPGNPPKVRMAATWLLGKSEDKEHSAKLGEVKETLGRWDWKFKRVIDEARKAMRGELDSGYDGNVRWFAPHPVEEPPEEEDWGGGGR